MWPARSHYGRLAALSAALGIAISFQGCSDDEESKPTPAPEDSGDDLDDTSPDTSPVELKKNLNEIFG